MAKINVGKGLKEYTKRLTQLKDFGREELGAVVFKGAEVVADAMKAELRALPVDNRYAKAGETLRGIHQLQKDGLIKGFGIAKMRYDGEFLNVKLGFVGYNDMRTASYPHGQPNSMIARSVVAGTSFRQRNDFVAKALRRAKDAEKVMQEEFDKALAALWPD